MVATRVRITLVTNMAGESGAVPAGLRRRFWRTAADVWRMVNGRLSLLSLSREVAGMTHAALRGGHMRKSAGAIVGMAAVLLLALASGLAFAPLREPGYPTIVRARAF